MEKPLLLALFCLGIGLLDAVRGFPVEYSSVSTGAVSQLWVTGYLVTAVGFLLTVIAIIFGCVCCKNGKGFKEFSNSTSSLSNARPEGFVNPTANAELTIFPPAGVHAGQDCRFEPLPELKPQVPNLRPAAFSYSDRDISSQDWFREPSSDFPRNQLKYVEEYGRGWFGRVVRGEAQNITEKESVSKVMVKILHEDATPTDQMYFLHEVKFYKDLKHPNILRLLGRCLETEPFLVILECYPNGDLKTFLSQNLPSAQALSEQGVTLRMCSNITSGLQYMHKNKFIHTDLAARNCLVGPDLTVKIGDYGNSIENFKSDYYCAGSVALPIRWCAPETLKCTDVTIETREVTPPANIWSLAVVFWEICEFCKLPYSELNDDEVIVRVLGDKNYFLDKPSMFCLHKDELYHLMKLCWNSPLQRPTASQLLLIFDNLISSGKGVPKDGQTDLKRVSQDFEQRWQHLRPNHIPKRDNALDSEYTADCSIISSKLKNAKVVDSSTIDSPLGLFMSTKGSGQESPRFCLKSDESSGQDGDESKSNEVRDKANFQLNTETRLPGILNPNQKFRPLDADLDSWLKGVEINNEEDESFVRKISEAIRDLDAALALERTSSSEDGSGKSSHQNSPEKENAETVAVEFKLGSDVSSYKNFTQKSFELSSLQNSEQPQSLNFTDPFINDDPKKEFAGLAESKDRFGPGNYALEDSLKDNDNSLVGGQSRHSSDTDDEVWRKRIERGEISEKVKEKSKSIANLMILTHIDPSDESDTDGDRTMDRHFHRSSFSRRSGSFARSSLSSNIFGSENDLTNAVLEDEFTESLKKLTNDHKEYGRFDSLGMIMPSLAGRENAWENLLNKSPVESPSAQPDDVHRVEKESATADEEPEKNDGDVFLDETNAKQLKYSKLDKDSSRNTTNNTLGRLGNVEAEPGEEPSRSQPQNNVTDVKCDSENNTSTSSSSFSPSAKDSSHLNEFVVDGRADQIENDNKESQSDATEGGSKADQTVTDSNGSKTEKTDERTGSGGNVAEPEGKGQIDFLCGSDGSSPTGTEQGNGNQRSNGSRSVPEITVSEEAQDEVDEVFVEETVTKPLAEAGAIRPFRFVLKDEEKSVPKILVTEEPAVEATQTEGDDGETVDLASMKREVKPFKFVLKDEKEVPTSKIDDLKNGGNVDEGKPKEFSQVVNFKDKDDQSGGGGDDTDKGTVIVGACEDYTLDFFKGLTTTSEDIVMGKLVDEENQRNLQNMMVKGSDLDWDKHLERSLIQQANECNFNDVSFGSLGYETSELESQSGPFDTDEMTGVYCPVEVITDFIQSEKVHTDKLTDLDDIQRLSMVSEEEYDNFKLRTPDDERSSDSGFRDKGSLSESVEDACEGKYNLEDIEAELEEAYVKGAFGHCDVDKENKEAREESKNSNNFEYEETKFYEDENKNEDDFSDIDGEIEFWQNKDSSDYYPEISEFNPTCSQGWYLHPPDENALTYSPTMNEDIANAIRNELRENLPVQMRSFNEFNDGFCEPVVEDPQRELNIHYASDFSIPLSPIIEEHDPSLVGSSTRKSARNQMYEGNNTSARLRKNVVNLMESVKSIDTNTFVQYLDYMIESEGKDLEELEDVENGRVSRDEPEKSADPATPNRPNSIALVDKSSSPDGEPRVIEEGTPTKGPDPAMDLHFDDDAALIFSPEDERSLSEISRSSNGTRTGDALSEITLSSPDLVPDCFAASSGQANEEIDIVTGGDGSKDSQPPGDVPAVVVDDCLRQGEPAGGEETVIRNGDVDAQSVNDVVNTSKSDEDASKKVAYEETGNASDVYEMSTSFMGDDYDDDDDDDDTDSDDGVGQYDVNPVDKEDFPIESSENDKSRKESCDDSFADDWDSDSTAAEEEDSSSSSGEFIWKLFGESQNGTARGIADATLSQSDKKVETNGNVSGKAGEGVNDEDDDDDDDTESSTGSSASITDFVPSAWNSQALPGRSILKSSDEKPDREGVPGKKSVWFKKQKYHCIYEYPREPSDTEDSDPFNQFAYEKGATSSDGSSKHFTFGVNTVEPPNPHFPYGISNVVNLSSFNDWDLTDGDDGDLSLTDTDSDNSGFVKGPGRSPKDADFNFYNLNSFDYDFNGSGANQSEFYVSSSSRPFQGNSSTNPFFPGSDPMVAFDSIDSGRESKSDRNESTESDVTDSRDFTTPDSGLEDSENASPTDKKPGSSPQTVLAGSGPESEAVVQILDTLKFNFSPESVGEARHESRDSPDGGSSEGFFAPDKVPQSPLSPSGLGELRHARSRLKLDLPCNHNADLGGMMNKKINRIH